MPPSFIVTSYTVNMVQVLFTAIEIEIVRIEKGLDLMNRTIIESHLIINTFIIPKHLTVNVA